MGEITTPEPLPKKDTYYGEDCPKGTPQGAKALVIVGATLISIIPLAIGVPRLRQWRSAKGDGRCGSEDPQPSNETVKGPEPLKQLHMAAANGDAGAQLVLGFRYAEGQGVPQDFAAAVRWTTLAAEQGNVTAQTNLGSAYYNGQGIARDFSGAIEWYRKAADQGHARAQFSLGYMYDEGEGVPRDSAQATEWYRRAAEQEYAPAIAALEALQATGSSAAR